MMISSLSGAGTVASVARHVQATPPGGADRAQDFAPRPAKDDEELIGFLRNITRADAAEVLALTRAPKGEAQQSADQVKAAYGEF